MVQVYPPLARPAPAERERPTTRRPSTPEERAALAAASTCVTKRSRPRSEAAQPAGAIGSPPSPTRQLLEAEQARLLRRLEENERILRGLLGTRAAYRLNLATVERLLAALPLSDATA